MAPSMRSKCIGAMVGSALGDAIGEIAPRFQDSSALHGWINSTDTLLYTDDTAMALGVAEALIEFGDVEAETLGGIFRRNYAREPWRGYGPTAPQVFAYVARRGASFVEAARTLERGAGSQGSGAAMRVAPIGLHFHDSTALRDRAEESARVTHAHPVAIDGAAAQAWAVAALVKLDPAARFPYASFCEDLARFARTAEIRGKLADVIALLAERAEPPAAAAALGLGQRAQDCLPFALFSFLRRPHAFAECVLCAVRHGGDSDTMGALAGAMAGAYLGEEAIPAGWARKLENVRRIREVGERLAAGGAA